MVRVLLINDEPDLLTLYELVLERGGHTVETLLVGADALDTVRRFHPDVIGLDWVIPDVHGEQVLQQLKSTPDTAHIPIVVITALAGLDSHVRLLGATRILHKPLTGRELVAAIEEVLGTQAQPTM